MLITNFFSDVIMVWHSYMLNPRDFLEDCIRNLKMKFWRAGIPWLAIDSCMNNETLEYSGTQESQNLFERTGLAWDNLHDSPHVIFPCPGCKQAVECPWTTCGDAASWDSRGCENGKGFADKLFVLSCPHCRLAIDHEKLRVNKFRRNMQDLLLNDTPMPGTILSIDGESNPTLFHRSG